MSREEQIFLNAILADETIEVPDALDWRKSPGRVSEVKNQGDCGSVWAFASTGALEGQETVRNSKKRSASSFKHLALGDNNYKIHNKSITLLSEQYLLDCTDENRGCSGGLMEKALRYIKRAGGIQDSTSYPYEAKEGECRFDKAKVAFKGNGAAILPVEDKQVLKMIVAKYGPVAISICANDWFIKYEHGIFVDDDCPSYDEFMNHAVLVVGYDTDPKEGDYWIVKNSWGAKWGEKGYIRMARNRNNMCGIATWATIPAFHVDT